MAVLALVLAVAIAVAVVVRRDPPVDPVAQDQPGPVLLVPGYGGSTARSRSSPTPWSPRGGTPASSGRPVPGPRTCASRRAPGDAVDETLDGTGAPSVDLVGYSAGGVVVRIYVADLGGGSHVRRAVTLASPHHGTDLASLAGALGSTACPTACQQLDPDSELLRRLNAGDETPPGPVWVALWTEDDKTVVPPDSGSLDGALDISLQSACPGVQADHADVPRTPAVISIVESVLRQPAPVTQPPVCKPG